jgi:serine/threonine protein kinase/tetratricopeptide (TPR) repeat protein
MNADQQKLNDIFFKALAKATPEERQDFVASACGQDLQLRRQLESLLEAHGEVGDFLKQGVFAPAGPSIGEKPGDMVGRYRLLQQIGEGGFGVVFMAEQLAPVRRLVALKIIKPGMDTKEVVARFEAERQALALMDHPNIAKVLDGGVTGDPGGGATLPRSPDLEAGVQGSAGASPHQEIARLTSALGPLTSPSGRPYFVMDLVKGIPITEFCEKHQLPIGARLKLFMQVCAGVQHAHQKGVIHRDLKPNNVLVVHEPGLPGVPKVIDFGIAKAIGQRLTERTLFTRFEQLIGTPAYMSPEQAEWSGLDVDTRSDLYSLGVLLYELLTGTTPLEKETLARAALDEMRRMIREVEPPKPSTRITALLGGPNRGGARLPPSPGQQEAEAQQELRPTSIDPASLHQRLHAVRGDLDWIVMKCLEKDRARRFETVNALARDLERHLNGEPVVARPPSKTYLAGKFIRKHRLTVTAVAGVALALVVGLLLALLGFADARRASRRANTAAARSEQVAEFLKAMLQGVGPSVALGRDTTLLREILDKTAARLAQDLKDQPLVEADLRNTLGLVYEELGQYTQAEAMHRQALALQRKLLGNDNVELAGTLGDLSTVLYDEGKLAEAEQAAREALGLERKFLGNEHVEVARSLNNLAEILRAQHNLAEVERLQREALAIKRKRVGENDESTGRSLINLAGVLEEEGQLAEAEALYREALAMLRKRFGDNYPLVATARNNLAVFLQKRGRLPEAETLSREAAALDEKNLGVHRDTAISLSNLGRILRRQGKLAEAEEFSRKAVEVASKASGPDDPWCLVYQHDLARVLQQEDKLAEAEATARQCLAIREAKTPDDWRTFQARGTLGGILLQQKVYAVLHTEGMLGSTPAMWADAEALLLSAYEGLRRWQGKPGVPDRSGLEEAVNGLVQLYEGSGRSAQAAEWKQKRADLGQRQTQSNAAPARQP